MGAEAPAAPRGDIIYKNDLGEPVLRATRLGGLTLFTPDRPGGTAAALAGAVRPCGCRSLAPSSCWSAWPRPAPGRPGRRGG
uniref:DUF4908 domain-containing protein n=1 Tax=Phenylobacterium glaciei TaxID=2803784 RepID=A0A974P6Q0_9CAUL|nr:DUF4908 domain-containing protein [Phenylobacterium glaciei]